MRMRILACAALLGVTGCERYFRVSEPSGGREYFTMKVDEQGSGAVKFDDLRTGSRITLQSSEVKEIKKADLPTDLQKR